MRALGEPLWFDEHAVPRYCQFTPDETANIYAAETVKLRIACQDCGHAFDVAVTWDLLQWVTRQCPSLTLRVTDRTIHYGDPPNIGCCPAGPTMNSEPKRVLEFWRKDASGIVWERVPELEIDLEV